MTPPPEKKSRDIYGNSLSNSISNSLSNSLRNSLIYRHVLNSSLLKNMKCVTMTMTTETETTYRELRDGE